VLLVASSRGRVEIDRDLSLKPVGPLALARLYGEFCMVQFRYCMSKNNEGNSLAEKYLSVIPNGRKYLLLF
jgi:hypothetical protein